MAHTKVNGLSFENNLPHQQAAVADILALFDGADIQTASTPEGRLKTNPLLFLSPKRYRANIEHLQQQNGLQQKAFRPSESRIVDIQMETGTGKTYTYTQTLFRLHQAFGVHKFVLIVPTLPIKAGTKAFLQSAAARQHFSDGFGGCEIVLHEVEALSSGKAKKGKTSVPQGLLNFANADGGGKEIHVLLINMGMLNSKSMDETVQESLFSGARGTAFEVLSAVKPLCIIDEPHRFSQENKTWANIEKIGAQYILRFGATFNQKYENLIHRLTGLKAFEQNLVKGVKAFVLDFQAADDVFIRYKGLSEAKTEAVFEISARHISDQRRIQTTTKRLGKNEGFGAIHAAMNGVSLENFNATQAVLSNGLAIGKSDKISPYDFSQSLHNSLLQQAVREHFRLERELLTRPNNDGKSRIKPLTLIFIDDIAGYRGEQSADADSLKNRFEAMVKAEAQNLLQTETDGFYHDYLTRTLAEVGATHGGYFAVDNSDKDEAVEQEINEILHDKEYLLSPDNLRRFVFSKWTLREGWDNPNVFQICKLRSSGSETSKLQEVGRGLRLPVNEFMQREKQEKEPFFLNYFVDFSEKDFVGTLKNEILAQAGVEETAPKQLNSELIDHIRAAYPAETRRSITRKLEDKAVIDENDDFLEHGWQRLQEIYPLAFARGSLNSKIIDSRERAPTTLIRKERYQALQKLWELINRRVVLEYRVENEAAFADLLSRFFRENIIGKLGDSRAVLEESVLSAYEGDISIRKGERHVITQSHGKTLDYQAFSKKLAHALSVNLGTLHQVLAALDWDYAPYQNTPTIREIHTRFKEWLLANFISTQQIGYREIHSSVHPTAFTDNNGEPKAEIAGADIGRFHSNEPVPDNYLFEQVFYDSDLERENICRDLHAVTVFTKIPKNTIRIPVAGGGTYSPDFAYVLHHKNGKQTLNLVVETKDTREAALREAEKQKIRHAEMLFAKLAEHSGIEVKFKTQFEADHIAELIQKLQ